MNKAKVKENELTDFRQQANLVIDWIENYLSTIENYPVKSQVKPGEIFKKLPTEAPFKGEDFTSLMKDLDEIIMPGITHWQSPNFHAYFPGNSSIPSLLGEMLTASIGAQCMKWETSPAATELEEMTMNWLKKMTGIPDNFHGVIQDTASTATLSAIITAREKMSDFSINKDGFTNQKFRVYCSSEAHSSIEKAVKIAGIGCRNLVKIKVDEEFALIPSELENAIKEDLEHACKPMCVVAALGTTGSTAIDPLKAIAAITKKYGVWLHVDAAYAGSALILPEYRWMLQGIEEVDSLVFNPHKWLFTNFDCSAYFVKDRSTLVNTFRLVPEYLMTSSDGFVNDYCDWGIQLGRRFRALKLWFVIRSFGVEGLQKKIRDQLALAQYFVNLLKKTGKFQILAPVPFTLVCFQYVPDINLSIDQINDLNEKILHKVNSSGEIYLSHTKLQGNYTLRLHATQTNIEQRHIDKAFKIIENIAKNIH